MKSCCSKVDQVDLFCINNTQELTDWSIFSDNNISPGIGISYSRGISYGCHDNMFLERFVVSSGGRDDTSNDNLSSGQCISYGCHDKKFHGRVVVSSGHRSSFVGRSAGMHLHKSAARVFFLPSRTTSARLCLRY